MRSVCVCASARHPHSGGAGWRAPHTHTKYRRGARRPGGGGMARPRHPKSNVYGVILCNLRYGRYRYARIFRLGRLELGMDFGGGV